MNHKRVGEVTLWIASIILLLLPSIYLAWHFGKIPNLGAVHDDALNWVTAKSIAGGSGYRLLSLPDQPAQTKYPPIYSLILSLAWKLNPNFPGNLGWAMALNWMMFAAFAVTLERFLATAGVGRESRFLLCLLLLFNHSILELVYTLWPDALFVTFALCALIILERRGAADRNALFAGCVAALAFLSKGAALPLLVTCPLVLLYQKRWRAALYFIAGWAPWLACWFAWVMRNRVSANDIVTIYYTDYFKLLLATTPFTALKVIIPANLMYCLTSLGSSLGLGSGRSLSGLIGGLAVLLVSTGGLYRAVSKGHLAIPAAFALAATAMVLVWHYPPTERYVLPVLPVLLAGAGLQLDWLLRQKSWARGVLLAVTGVSLVVLFAADVAPSDSLQAGWTAELDSLQPDYRWMAANLPRDARVLSQKDPLLYLYTGLHGYPLMLSPTHLIYSTNEGQRMYVVRHLEEYLSRYQLSYILEHQSEGYLGMRADEEAEITRAFHTNRHFRVIYQDRFNVVYKVDLDRLAKAAPGETFIPPRAADF